MNSKKIIIYQHDTLFNILDEIKEILNFEIIKADKKIFEDYKKNTKADYLFILKFEDKYLQNQLQITNIPIKIEKLIEQINLKFLVEKFQYQSDISVGFYKLNLNSRIITKDTKSMDLTEREVKLILFLKETLGAVTIEKLQKEVWEHGSKLETHTVETHIYRLRKKIKKKFNDENFIISSKEGYLINWRKKIK